MSEKTKKIIRGTSLFSNIGISETYFQRNNLDIVVANELIQKRCDFFSYLYPKANMICGDITNEKTISSNYEKKGDKTIPVEIMDDDSDGAYLPIFVSNKTTFLARNWYWILLALATVGGFILIIRRKEDN